MEPMLLKPVGKDYLWGGSRLRDEYNKDCPQIPLAETWECSVHPDGPSKIANGIDKGKTLDKVLHEHPEYLGTKVTGGLQNAGNIRIAGELPILVKFIDAEKDLSVQVHPCDEYARTYEHQNGKTEMWYVLDAKPGATLVCGFAFDMTPEILKAAVATGTLDKHLQKVSVHKGDVFYIPAGTIHAIGAGALIAEIQESSNVTYRVYDYDRIDKNGQRRPLHFDKAIEVLDMKAGADVRQKPRKVNYYYGCAREVLCRCKYFEIERVVVSLGFSFTVMLTSFQVLLCVSGSGGITSEDRHKPLRFKKGDCIFLPAGLGRCYVLGNCEMLKIRC